MTNSTLDSSLTLNEAIDLFIQYLFKKQDQVYETPENLIPKGYADQGQLKRSAEKQLKKLIDLEDALNDWKE